MAKKYQNTKVNKPAPATATPKVAVKPVEPSSDFWIKHLFPILIFAALIAVLYGASLKYRYVLDDSIVITGNKFTKQGIGGCLLLHI